MPSEAESPRLSPPSEAPAYAMQCMEIWGDNRPADNTIRTPGLDVHVISRPLDGAGGDVHYLSLCGSGLITRILLADVSGHGTPVVESARDLRKMIRRYINTKSQGRLVSQLNEKMMTWWQSGLFATSLVATYLANKRRLTISNAGHPRPLVFRQRTRTWSLLDATPAQRDFPSDLPLGVIEGTIYTEKSLELETGDRVVFYTDFLIETKDRGGAPLGEQDVLDVVRRVSQDGRSAARALLEEIVSNARTDSPSDDVTILELCHNGQGPRPPGIAEKLNVYGKFFGIVPV